MIHEVEGMITETWPLKGYTGFVYTRGRKQSWAYMRGGVIFAYGATQNGAWTNAIPKVEAKRAP